MAFTGVARDDQTFQSLRMRGPIYSNTVVGLVALAAGGQAGATPLTGDINVVSTVATAADSVMLPVAEAGRDPSVINAGANAMAVFPAVGDKINALSANASFSVAAGKSATFIGTAAGQWYCLLSA